MTLRLSISDVRTFLECRRKWTFRSRNAMGLEPSQPSKALMLGTAVHEALAAYYGNKLQTIPEEQRAQFSPLSAFSKSWAHQLSSYGIPQVRIKSGKDDEFSDLHGELSEARELGHGMVKHYVRWAEVADRGYTVEAVEFPFEVPIDYTGVTFSGVIDLVLRDKLTGRLYIVDHKTYTSPPNETLLQMDLQALAYEWAVSEKNVLGIEGDLAGTIFNVLRKRVPGEVKVLKSGKLSKNKRQLVTPEIYRQAVRDHGLNMAEYEGFIRALDPNKFNERHTIMADPARRRYFVRVLRQARDEMKRMIEDATMLEFSIPTTTRACAYCDFRDLCMASITGCPNTAHGKFRKRPSNKIME